MLARCGVAGTVLFLIALFLVAAEALGISIDGLRTLFPYALLGLSLAAFVVGEAVLAIRKAGARRAWEGPRLAMGRKARHAQAAAAAPTTPEEQVSLLRDVLKLAHPMPDVDRFEPVDVGGLVAELISSRADPRLTRFGRPAAVHTLGSYGALKRAIEILISNALATGTRAFISCDHGTSLLVIHVDDDGPGIAKEQRAHVLHQRYYMSTPHALQIGCRAEIVIARQIVEAHGGDIVVGCSPLGGARFTVRLPLLDKQEIELSQAS